MTGSGMRTFTDEFKREAVRLVQTSGRTIGQIADDLGIGHSTLGKWLAKHRETELLAGPHDGGIARRWDRGRASARCPADARERPESPAKVSVQENHRQRPWRPRRSQRAGPGLRRRWSRPEMGADISYIWTAEGWLYLAVVVDLFSRRIVGWATSDRMKKDLALTALKRALATRQSPPGLIHHSDRGRQYCSGDDRKLLADHKIVASMSSKGNCYDNAMVETVFKTIRSELIWRTIWQSRRQAEIAVGRYIDDFYNPIRRHSAWDI